MRRLRLQLTASLFLFLVTVPAVPAGTPAPAGMDPAKLREIPTRLQKFVDDEVISGAVTLVGRHGQIASLEAVGRADNATGKLMRTDNLFWIASMTKPITATAILMLQDAGQLNIEDAVDKYLPEFQEQWLLDSQSRDARTLKRPARKITVRDLLTHTSGLADGPAVGRELSLAEMTLLYSQQPLRFAPGSKWQYSNPGINTLGRIVEVVSGQKYQDFLQRRIFNPLGMKDTTFYPTASQIKRIAKSYAPAPGGSGLMETNVYFLGTNLASRARAPRPAGGLFSTASDLFRFYQMILSGGTWHGQRLVSREAIEQMRCIQTGDLKTGFTDGNGWGLGWCVVRQPTGVTAMLSPGTFGHGGAYGTQGWIDPQRDLIVVLMIQRAKLNNADASDMRKTLQEIAVAAIQD